MRRTQNKIALIGQWMHVYKGMKGHLRLYRGGEGNEETLLEWLRGKGTEETPGVYNNTS